MVGVLRRHRVHTDLLVVDQRSRTLAFDGPAELCRDDGGDRTGLDRAPVPARDPRLPPALRVGLLRQSPAHALSDLHLLGRSGGQLPVVDFLGRAPGASPDALRPILRVAGHDRLQPDPAVVDSPSGQAGPLPLSRRLDGSHDADGWAGSEPSAAELLDGDSPADHVHRLRFARHPVRIRHRGSCG